MGRTGRRGCHEGSEHKAVSGTQVLSAAVIIMDYSYCHLVEEYSAICVGRVIILCLYTLKLIYLRNMPLFRL